MQQRLRFGRPAGREWRVVPPWPAWPSRAGVVLAAWLLAERDRWLLWLPVCLGLGIAAFFSLPGEPPLLLTFVVLATGAVATLGAWQAQRAGAALGRASCIGLAAVTAGFALAHARLLAVEAPVLPREATYTLTGRVAALEPRGRGVRVRLDGLELSRLDPAETPHAVRITIARGGEDLRPGDRVRVRARLQPPGGPAVPGSFDYARQAYFERLGGVGYAVGAPELLAGDRTGSTLIAELRAQIARRITEILPGTTGAFAAALIAGVRAAIDQKTWREFQISGLAHLISISGLHMTLVAGTVFGFARVALALLPWVALRIRVHKPAAILAFAAASFYALLAGSTVPTQRSFLMLAVGLGAILVDRNPFSLRVLAWAAVVVLAFQPEALLGASFQLSFAAVLALMASYEAFRLRREGSEAERGIAGRGFDYVLGVAATTVIASTATAPFTAYHFQNVATYGVLANLVAVPITSFIVMPAGLLGLVLMPFGLDGPVFQLMGLGVDAVLATASLVAVLPGAAVAVAQWPVAALVLMALGGLWLMLWRTRWRLLGIPLLALAGLIALLARPPVLLVDPDLAAAAYLAPDGQLILLEWQRDGRRRENWLRIHGLAEWVGGPVEGEESAGVACDRAACLLKVGSATISLSRSPAAAAEDCGLAHLVIARAGPERCEGGAHLIGPRALRASDGLAIRPTRGGLALEAVSSRRGHWPWSRAYGPGLPRKINLE